MKWILAVAVLSLSSTAAAQVNRCIIDGQLSWQSEPCPPGAQYQPGIDQADDDPAYQLAYRLAQSIERTYLSFLRCQREEAGGCRQFSERYITELAPLLAEAQDSLPAIARSPAATALLRRHMDDLNEMTQLMQAAQGLQQGLLTLPSP